MAPEGDYTEEQMDSTTTPDVVGRATTIGEMPIVGNPIPENWPPNVAPPEGTTRADAEAHFAAYQDSGQIKDDLAASPEMIQHDSVVPAAEGDTFADIKEVDTREQMVSETMRAIASFIENGDIDGAIRNAEILKQQLSDLKIQKNAVNSGETGLIQ